MVVSCKLEQVTEDWDCGIKVCIRNMIYYLKYSFSKYFDNFIESLCCSVPSAQLLPQSLPSLRVLFVLTPPFPLFSTKIPQITNFSANSPVRKTSHWRSELEHASAKDGQNPSLTQYPGPDRRFLFGHGDRRGPGPGDLEVRVEGSRVLVRIQLLRGWETERFEAVQPLEASWTVAEELFVAKGWQSARILSLSLPIPTSGPAKTSREYHVPFIVCVENVGRRRRNNRRTILARGKVMDASLIRLLTREIASGVFSRAAEPSVASVSWSLKLDLIDW